MINSENNVRKNQKVTITQQIRKPSSNLRFEIRFYMQLITTIVRSVISARAQHLTVKIAMFSYLNIHKYARISPDGKNLKQDSGCFLKYQQSSARLYGVISQTISSLFLSSSSVFIPFFILISHNISILQSISSHFLLFLTYSLASTLCLFLSLFLLSLPFFSCYFLSPLFISL